jgi:hypothetical protein
MKTLFRSLSRSLAKTGFVVEFETPSTFDKDREYNATNKAHFYDLMVKTSHNESAIFLLGDAHPLFGRSRDTISTDF